MLAVGALGTVAARGQVAGAGRERVAWKEVSSAWEVRVTSHLEGRGGRALRLEDREGSEGSGRSELWHPARVEWSALARQQPAPAVRRRER